MTAIGFKIFLENALEKTIQEQAKLLLHNDTPVAESKRASGARFSLNAVKVSLDDWFNDCVNMARVEVTPTVFADFVKHKVAPHLTDIENALLEARYDTPQLRSEIKGRWDGFNAISNDVMKLAEDFISKNEIGYPTSISVPHAAPAAARLPASAAVNASMTAAEATEALNASTAPVSDATAVAVANTEDAAHVAGGSV